MEVLLFILFMLFSIVSSLLERRKRKRELENARQAEATRSQSTELEEEEEEVTVGWPFGGGKDPFEDEELTRRFGDLQRLGEKEDKPELDATQVMEQAVASEPSSVSQTQVRDALAEAKASAGGSEGAVRRAGRWNLDAKKARDAIVYSEILGPPKAMRSEER